MSNSTFSIAKSKCQIPKLDLELPILHLVLPMHTSRFPDLG